MRPRCVAVQHRIDFFKDVAGVVVPLETCNVKYIGNAFYYAGGVYVLCFHLTVR